MDIRKISIGPDYKSGAMHYIVGQSILGDSNIIHLIRRQPETGNILIYIINVKEEVVLWKEFSATMPISIEFNINY
jgi:ABC-type ATPase involved in cell division